MITQIIRILVRVYIFYNFQDYRAEMRRFLFLFLENWKREKGDNLAGQGARSSDTAISDCFHFFLALLAW